jgi:hypothetical protein
MPLPAKIETGAFGAPRSNFRPGLETAYQFVHLDPAIAGFFRGRGPAFLNDL